MRQWSIQNELLGVEEEKENLIDGSPVRILKNFRVSKPEEVRGKRRDKLEDGDVPGGLFSPRAHDRQINLGHLSLVTCCIFHQCKTA